MLKVVGDDGTRRGVTAFKMRDEGGVLRTVMLARIRTPQSTLKTFFTVMTVSASPPVVYGYGPVGSPVTSAAVTATVIGGSPPFSYAWARTDSDPWSVTILAPTQATAAFMFNAPVAYEPQVATFRCTVTDADGTIAITNTVTANVQAYDFGGIGV